MNMTDPCRRPRVALIAGPTASGKSALALALAERERGTIVNADASQVYRDLRILTARPSPAEEARAPHRLFGTRDAALPCSAADWAADAQIAIAAVLDEGRLPILVGGTGLYLRTLLDGIAPVAPVDPAVREAVRAMPREAARYALEREDAAAAAALHPNDSARAARALEVIRSTGRSILSWRADRSGGIRDAITLDPTILDPPVAELYARCDRRVLAMVEMGVLDEIAALLARNLDPALPAMRAIGVREFGRHLREGAPLAEAIAAVQQATRNYAKRQRTWLRHQQL